MTAPSAVMLAIAVCAAGAVICLLASRSKAAAGWLSFATVALSSGLVLLASTRVLMGGHDLPESYLALPSLGSDLRVHVDGLSAVFLALVAAVALLAALYSVSYMRHYKEYGVGRYYPYFLLFIGGMYGILTTTDLMFFFFVFWQLMTLPSFALIRYENRKRENVAASNRYLIMMEAACALVVVSAALLGRGGTLQEAGLARYDFDSIAAAMPGLLGAAPGVVALGFGLMLVGFGIKAGIWPFGQMWLPDAHPAAPSPVSALLSGVMIKTGVYGLMRTFFWLVPAEALPLYPAAAWGGTLAALGALTLFVGTAQALRQEQTKRLLAFSSIGQVGYIVLGMGAALALTGRADSGGEVAALAALALYGALFHTANHAAFKSLLFLNAGSVLRATDAQDLNRLGGLMRFMPVTAVTALIASLSIAGVPLLSGFASKWAIYVSTFLGSGVAGYLAICGVIAVLTGALTLALFMKFFGTAFLSRTSELAARCAERGPMEADWLMQIPQLALAAVCVVLGVAPVTAYRALEAALAQSGSGLAPLFGRPLAGSPEAVLPWVPLEVLGGQAVMAPVAAAAVLAVLLMVSVKISRLGAAPRRASEVWLCGYAVESEAHRYVAANLYGEVNKRFRWLGGASRAHSPASGGWSGEASQGRDAT